jgi:hypothetical protein
MWCGEGENSIRLVSLGTVEVQLEHQRPGECTAWLKVDGEAWNWAPGEPLEKGKGKFTLAIAGQLLPHLWRNWVEGWQKTKGARHEKVEILDPPDVRENLSEVKRLSADGIPVKDIALRLSISEITVKRYRKKLGIHKRKGQG